MLKRMIIKDLFGRPDNNRDIHFRHDLTILVGRNGSGKTTILNILNILMTKAFHRLFEYEFSEIILEASPGVIEVIKRGDALFVKRTDVHFEDIPDIPVAYRKDFERLMRTKDMSQIEIIVDKLHYANLAPTLSQYFEKIERRRRRRSTEPSAFDSFDYDLESLYFPTFRRLETDLFETLLHEQSDSIHIPRNLFLLEQRGKDTLDKLPHTIIGYSHKDIRDIVAKRWSDINEEQKGKLNALVGQMLLTFLHLPEGSVKSSADPEEAKQTLQEVFERTGMIGHAPDAIESIQEFTDRVKWARKNMDNPKALHENATQIFPVIILWDRVKKILELYDSTRQEIDKIQAPFENLKQRLQGFMDKQVDISEGELRFISDGDSLRFEDLSAGEKQLVTFFVYTRLALGSGGVVLIDEPELSLHVSWQRRFLQELLDGVQDMQCIVSTHSPFLINHFHDKLEVVGADGVAEEGDEDEP